MAQHLLKASVHVTKEQDIEELDEQEFKEQLTIKTIKGKIKFMNMKIMKVKSC